MMKINIEKFGEYHVGHVPSLTEAQIREILPLLTYAPKSSKTILGGRREIVTAEINGLGNIAVKQYARGGIPGLFIKETYLGLGQVRSFSEFQWLVTANDLGIAVPQPLACAWKGKLLYKCWLIMQDIGAHNTLAQISLSNEVRVQKLMPKIQEQIFLMVNNNILHIDLHPGNILIDERNRLFIIDFDKARYFSGSRDELVEKYVRRWERAIVKHRLPAMLNDVFDLNGSDPA